jgi:biotin synthase
MSFDGTPLAGTRLLHPTRFACPAAEIRMAGGRKMHLRSLQPLALHLANSLFLGDCLTSEGQAAKIDLEMIADAGFRVLPNRGADGHHASEDSQARAAVRGRCAGTGIRPNA